MLSTKTFLRTAFKTAQPCPVRFATFIASGGTKDPLAYCKELVQKHDYPSFLVGQFYPKSQQLGYYGLKAFFVCVPLFTLMRFTY